MGPRSLARFRGGVCESDTMSTPAHVTSLDALRALRETLLHCDAEFQEALTQLTIELRRVLAWIEEEQARYWPQQVKRGSDRVAEARLALERCEARIGTEDPPACYEQKQNLERARRRLRFAEDQVQLARRWKIRLRQEVQELEGQLSQFGNFLESQMPRATATLDRQVTALEKYVQSGDGGQP